jgi:hypothetical protein
MRRRYFLLSGDNVTTHPLISTVRMYFEVISLQSTVYACLQLNIVYNMLHG